MDPARLRTALTKVQSDPYDMDAWMLVIKDAQTKRIEESRETFEKLVSVFPTSGRFWKVYIEQEVWNKTTCQSAADIVNRALNKFSVQIACLPACCDVDLPPTVLLSPSRSERREIAMLL
jgi:hypothetical protein